MFSSIMEQSHDEQKVLRVAVIFNGSVIEERLIERGEPVSIGSDWRNTFLLTQPYPDSFGEKFTLCKVMNNQYCIVFNEHMDIKMKDSDGLLDLRLGSIASLIKKQNGFFILPLKDTTKGVITLGEYKFILQFVRVPNCAVRKAANYRQKRWNRDDLSYLGFLSVFTLATLNGLMWVLQQQRPQLLDKSEVEDLLAEYISIPIEILDDFEEPIASPVSVIPQMEPKKIEHTVNQNPQKGSHPTDSKTSSSKSLTENERIVSTQRFDRTPLGLLLTRGKSKIKSKFELNSESIDSILEDVTTGEELVDTRLVTRKQKDVLGRSPSGKISLKSAKSISGRVMDKAPNIDVVKPKIEIEKIDSGSKTQREDINKVVRRYLSQVKQCHESRLKIDPTIAGRVVVDLEIENGRVISLYTASNTTKDSDLAKCVIRKIKRWRFPSDCSDFASFPFVFTPLL